nr:NTF2-like N-terminal transpeptidase domain-containing protein [Halalkalibacter alkalisediminis]
MFQTFALEWEQGDYAAMYESLSSQSKELVSADEFIELHTTTYTEIEASDLSIILISPEKEENEKIEGSEITLQYEKNLSMFTGDIKLDSAVSLSLDEEKNEWLIDWNPEFIFPMMEVGDRVKLRTLYPSERVFDRHNQELAVNGTIYEIGVVPGRVENQEEEIKQLSKQINVSEEFIRGELSQTWVGPDTFVPLKMSHSISKHSLKSYTKRFLLLLIEKQRLEYIRQEKPRLI